MIGQRAKRSVLPILPQTGIYGASHRSSVTSYPYLWLPTGLPIPHEPFLGSSYKYIPTRDVDRISVTAAARTNEKSAGRTQDPFHRRE